MPAIGCHRLRALGFLEFPTHPLANDRGAAPELDLGERTLLLAGHCPVVHSTALTEAEAEAVHCAIQLHATKQHRHRHGGKLAALVAEEQSHFSEQFEGSQNLDGTGCQRDAMFWAISLLAMSKLPIIKTTPAMETVISALVRYSSGRTDYGLISTAPSDRTSPSGLWAASRYSTR